MHTVRNFKTKQELREAVRNGERVMVQADPIGSRRDGKAFIEGPHEYHKWYAEVEIKDLRILRVNN